MTDPVPELRILRPTAHANHSGGLSRLDVFLGDWEMRGQQFAGPFGPEAEIVARESYEWLPGEHFMMMRFDGQRGDAEMGCVEIIGEAPHVGHGFCAHAYYNDGARRIWRIGEKNGVWIRTGEEMTGDGLIRTRCTTTLSTDGLGQHSVWDYARPGEDWTPFWDVAARHAG